jgi:putative transposase
MPEYGEINAQVLQDVALRVDRAFEAYFRRLREGQTPGSPRCHGCDRSTSFTYPQVGEHGGARLDTGMVMLSKKSGGSPCDGLAEPGGRWVARLFLLR